MAAAAPVARRRVDQTLSGDGYGTRTLAQPALPIVNSAHAPSHFPGSGRPWPKVKREYDAVDMCVHAAQVARTALANPSTEAENDGMEQETGVGCMYADCDRTSRVPPWAPCATRLPSNAHDERQRCWQGTRVLLAVRWRYIRGTWMPGAGVSALVNVRGTPHRNLGANRELNHPDG